MRRALGFIVALLMMLPGLAFAGPAGKQARGHGAQVQDSNGDKVSVKPASKPGFVGMMYRGAAPTGTPKPQRAVQDTSSGVRFINDN